MSGPSSLFYLGVLETSQSLAGDHVSKDESGQQTLASMKAKGPAGFPEESFSLLCLHLFTCHCTMWALGHHHCHSQSHHDGHICDAFPSVFIILSSQHLSAVENVLCSDSS